MDKLPITAIVVLYHSKHLLPLFIDNIIERIVGLNEIILVDNSNDDLSIFESALVQILHPGANIGYGSAINIGVRKATNETIIIMNPDIYIHEYSLDYLMLPEYYLIAGLHDKMLHCPKFPTPLFDLYRLLFCNLAKFFGPLCNLFRSENIPLARIFYVDWLHGAMIITTKSTLISLNGFDENYFLFYEDVDICQRATKKDIPVMITKNIRYSNLSCKSSNVDTSEIKIKSEINSLQRYHLLYSNKITTFVAFFLLKYLSFVISKSLSYIKFVKKSNKISSKSIQYYYYYKYIFSQK